MSKMRTGRMQPVPKGKTLGKTSVSAPKANPIGQDYAAVSKAGDKNKQRQATASAAPKPMSKAKKAAIAIGTGVAAAGKVAYDLYHDGLRKDYGTHRASLTFKEQESVKTHPSNRELRKWKKSR